MPEDNLKTILIFTDYYIPGYRAGGPVQSVYNLAVLLKREYHIKVVCRDRDLNEKAAYSGIETGDWTHIEERHEVMYLPAERKSLKKILSLIRENREHIVYINGLYSFYFSLFPVLCCMVLNIRRVFIQVRGMLHKSALSVKPVRKQVFLAFARGFGLYRSYTMLASGEEEAVQIRKAIGKANVLLAPNVPLMPETEVPPAREFRKKNGVVSFLYVGRIAPEKNPLALLEAIKELNTPCIITFCGTGLNEAFMLSFINMLNSLPGHITATHIPFVPHHKVTELMHEHDIFVMPSLGENFGHAIFEAFVSAMPVIIGNNTPWKDAEETGAGYAVDPMNREELVQALRNFTEMNEEEYTRAGRAAFSIALNYLKSNNFSEIYKKLFS